MRRLALRLAAAALLVASAPAAPAQAQAPHLITVPDRTDFLTRFDYALSIEALGSSDSRFDWNGHFGGDFDVVGGPRGRVNVLFDYEMLLGGELQPFDPNQSLYVIEVLGGGRSGALEASGVFQHVSRHLGDRAKAFGIAWNLLGAQVAWTRIDDARAFQVRGRAMKGLTADFVDYSGEFSGDVLYRRRLSPRTSLVGRASAVARTVSAFGSRRGTQTGGRGEAAYRLLGPGGALEVYGAIERRIDADPFDRRPVTWATIGLRLESPD